MGEKEKIKVIAVVGPTASGKTSVGIHLAKHFGGEIISADSMQIYTDMQIATAKPSKEEMQGIPHHMMGFLPVSQSYSVASYVEQAKKCIFDINSRNKIPIIVGGTGLYIDSLLNNVCFSNEDDNSELRKKLMERLEKEGGNALHNELMKIDRESAMAIHPNNGKRVVRALEIYYSTGMTMTEHKKMSKRIESPFDCVYIGLKCLNRQNLYDRINHRADVMIKEGLEAEARRILALNLGETSKMAIGYKELEPYIKGYVTFDEAVENLKMQTRRYAKRQLTWFLRNEKINWIDTDTFGDIQSILDYAVLLCKRGGIIEQECYTE